jgi:hypothetical protein
LTITSPSWPLPCGRPRGPHWNLRRRDASRWDVSWQPVENGATSGQAADADQQERPRRAHSLIHSTPMVQVKQDGHPAVTKRYTHCERRYGQYDWDVSSSASQVVSRKVSGVQTASAPGTSAVLAARWARFGRISAAGDPGESIRSRPDSRLLLSAGGRVRGPAAAPQARPFPPGELTRRSRTA